MSTTAPYDSMVITNTLVGLGQSIARYLGIQSEIDEGTTLNELLNIHPDVPLDTNDIPVAKYFCIGNAGHTIDPDDLVVPMPVQLPHQPTDQGPFRILPFVLRPVANDLTDAERARYALRTLVEIDGSQYWAYYLKRIDHRGTEIKYYKTTVRNGESVVVPFKHSSENLIPVPPKAPYYPYNVDQHAIPSDGDYVHVSASIKIVLDQFDTNELLNVASIMYKNPSKAIISEIGICTGVDKPLSGESFVGSPFIYNEAIAVCPDTWLSVFTNMSMQNAGQSFDVEVTQGAPMLLAPK